MDWDARFHNFLLRVARRLQLRQPIQRVEPEFSPGYRALVEPQQAVRDLLLLEAAAGQGGFAVDLRRRRAGDLCELRIYSRAEATLDELTPFLHNLGLPAIDQTEMVITIDEERGFIRRFLTEPVSSEDGHAKRRVLEALLALLLGRAENDALNQLITSAGFGWRDVELLRAYCGYKLQLGGAIARARLYEALLGQVAVTRLLFSYFETRFRREIAARGDLDALTELRQKLIGAFDQVTDLTDDRILRDIFNLIDATLRTSFYLNASATSNVIALKIDSLGVISAPNPKPMVEIYVHSPSMEGIHLRGARVSRGGVRWSDRSHDLRMEILDLMQTQMVKNALIVPQGAKGGFALKARSDDRRCAENGKIAYREFIGSLLDLTDNVGRAAPAELVCYDADDPYLVVAADKGTGGWSDVANEIAQSRDFWLGDAFATGGSNGFHHKRLGITARGAWVCVRRHFRELGRDIDNQAFTVVGVGSMDGDVFGNGMLQTSTIRLLGAFSGRHIFVDPNPDPQTSFAERRRLFDTPNSTWADYDASTLSVGGGVYPRDAKDIDLSAEARAWLGIANRLIDGEGLIRLLLTAQVDLLWMGGVGCYVKASSETNDMVGDRANDGARVNAKQLRAKVVGEGANIAFTKDARVQYALNGGRIDTDAIDNSGGVDLSDHEVNLKILLRDLSSDDAFQLKAMTDEVCTAVLDDSYRQSLCLSLERERCRRDVTPYLELADQFEASGRLDRANDAFPTRKEVLARTEKELTRPELALLMAYAKLALKSDLLEAPNFFRAEWTRDHLHAYFPVSLRSRCKEAIERHPLAKEIAATVISNCVIDQAGARFLLFADTSSPGVLADAVGSYLAFDQILEGERWRSGVRDMDRTMPTSRQYDYLLQLEDALAYLCRWTQQRGFCLKSDEADVSLWRVHLQQFLAYLEQSDGASILGAEAPEASREMFLSRLRDFPFLVELSRLSRKGLEATARLFDETVELLGSRQIASLTSELTARDAWEERLQEALGERLRAAPARIAQIALRSACENPYALFQKEGLIPQLGRLQKLHAELLESAPPTVAPYALFASELESLIEACDAPRKAA